MQTIVRHVLGPATILGALALASAPLPAQDCPSGPVALEARSSLLLPASVGIQGVATGPAGTLALWSAAGEVFSIAERQALSRFALPDSIRPAGMAITPEGLRLLDQASGREFLLAYDGSIAYLGEAHLGLAEQIDQALWRGDGWILGLRDLADRRFVLRRFSFRDQSELFRSARSDSVKTIERYHLTDSRRGLLLTRTMPPFTLIRIDLDRGRTDTLETIAPEQAAGIQPDSLPHWRALPTVALDCTLLLTLSDLTADRRILVRYGATGRIERVTELEAPLGLMARLPGEESVLAARRAGELELVWYDWHWVREPSTSTP